MCGPEAKDTMKQGKRRRKPAAPAGPSIPVTLGIPQNSDRGDRATALEKAEAEWAFVREGRTLQEIATAHGRTFSTIQQWAKQGLWEQARKNFLLSDQGQADILQDQVRMILLDLQKGTRQLTAPLAHMILMSNRAAKEMRGDRYSMAQLFVVLKDFLRFVRAAKPDLLPLLEPVVEAFLQAKKAEMLPGRKG